MATTSEAKQAVLDMVARLAESNVKQSREGDKLLEFHNLDEAAKLLDILDELEDVEELEGKPVVVTPLCF